MTPVTDPNILAQLNGSGPKPVTDPALLSQLNGEEKSGGFMSSAADFVKSIPRGALSGLSNALSGSGQAAQLEMGQPVDVPSGPDTTKILEQNVTGKLPEPQGRAGRFGAAVGEGLGNPVSWVGPGGIVLKTGTAILGSLGSETGGQAAEGTKFEIPARLAGGLAGGVAAAKALGPTTAKAAAPTYRELKDAAVSDYNAARNSGLELHPQGVASFASKVEQELSGPNHGFTGGQFGDAPKTFSVLDTLQKPPAGATVTASNVDAIRKNLGRLSRETSEGKPTPDAAAASVALENLNKYTESIPQNHIVAGDPAEYVRATQQGNANYAAAQRVRTFDAKITRAEKNSEGGIATSIDNQIKAQARTILNNPKAQRGFNAEEIGAIDELNKGTITSNTLRQLGRGGSGVIPMAMHAAAAVPAAAATGGTSLVIQALLGAGLYGAKKTAEGMTKSKAAQITEMLAKRSPEYESRAAAIPAPDKLPGRAAVARALLESLQH